jgi:2-haloacid dehalogenase
MTPRAVVFDIGRVLVEWNPERHYDRVIGTDRRRELFRAVDLHRYNERVDLGEDVQTVMAETATLHPDWAAEVMIWADDWLRMASPDIPETAHLLRALKARGVPVYALSNFGTSTFQVACTAYPVLREFDLAFISGHHGMIKPDPAFYALLENAVPLPPQALLFTDDRAENIEAAARRGWHTHLFTGAGGLGARLVDEGLLTQEDLP